MELNLVVIDEENIEEVLDVWDTMSQDLKKIKSAEMNLRKDLVAFLAPDGVPGVHRRGFGDMIAKATLKLNHKFDTLLLEENYESFSNLEKDAVKYTPSLSLSQYKKIPEALRELLDETLIVTPAAPTLEIQYRKDTKND